MEFEPSGLVSLGKLVAALRADHAGQMYQLVAIRTRLYRRFTRWLASLRRLHVCDRTMHRHDASEVENEAVGLAIRNAQAATRHL